MYRESSKIYRFPAAGTNCDNVCYHHNSLRTAPSDTQWVLGRLFLLATLASAGRSAFRSALGSDTLHGVASTFRSLAQGVRQAGGGIANSLSKATDYF